MRAPKTIPSCASAPTGGNLPDSSAKTWAQDIASGDDVVVTGSGNLEPWIEALRPTRVFRPGDATPFSPT